MGDTDTATTTATALPGLSAAEARQLLEVTLSFPGMLKGYQELTENRFKTLAEKLEEGERRLNDIVDTRGDLIQRMGLGRQSPMLDDEHTAAEQLFVRPHLAAQTKIAAAMPRHMLRKALQTPTRAMRKGFPAVADYVEELQQLNDETYTLMNILPRLEGSRYYQMSPRNVALNLPQFKAFMSLLQMGRGALGKAMSTTGTGTGAEFIPVEYSGKLIDRVDLATRTIGQFDKFPMTTKTAKLPGAGAAAVVYNADEATTDDKDNFTTTTPGTRNTELIARKLGAKTWMSVEQEEDGIIATLDFVMDQQADATTHAIEDATYNGDRSAALDSDLVAGSHKTVWDGLRKTCNAGAKKDFATAFNGDVINGVPALMGVYGPDPTAAFWGFGIKGYNKLRMLKDSGGNPLVVTMSDLQGLATMVKGALGVMFGSDVVLSRHIRENVNTSGNYDGTTITNGACYYVHKKSYIYGDRRKMTIKSREKIENDQLLIVTTWRGDFKKLRASADNPCGMGINWVA